MFEIHEVKATLRIPLYSCHERTSITVDFRNPVDLWNWTILAQFWVTFAFIDRLCEALKKFNHIYQCD